MRLRVASGLNVCAGFLFICGVLVIGALISATLPAIAASSEIADVRSSPPRSESSLVESVGILAGPVDLLIGKTAYPVIAFPGQTITYTLVFANAGASLASGVRVTDTLPAEIVDLAFESSALITQVSSVAPTWAWDVEDLDSGESHVITLTCTIDPSMTGDRTIDNGSIITDVSPGAIETNPLDNSSTASIYVRNAPELEIGKSADPAVDVAYRGEITYTIAVTNSGIGDALGAIMLDVLPGQVGFARWVLQPPGSTEAVHRIDWAGDLDAGDAITWTFVVSHVGYYGGVFTNTASIWHIGRDTRRAAAAVVLQDSPNPTIVKSVVSPPTVTIGSLITYELAINLPPDAAQDLLITDTLAEGLEYRQPSASQLASNHPLNQGRLNQPARIATDRTGNSHIVWSGRDGSDNEVWLQRIAAGGQHGLPLQLTDNGYQDRDPDIAVDASGNTHVVWEGITDSGCRRSVSPEGRSWTAAEPQKGQVALVTWGSTWKLAPQLSQRISLSAVPQPVFFPSEA